VEDQTAHSALQFQITFYDCGVVSGGRELATSVGVTFTEGLSARRGPTIRGWPGCRAWPRPVCSSREAGLFFAFAAARYGIPEYFWKSDSTEG
jgi:hypothetical protein